MTSPRPMASMRSTQAAAQVLEVLGADVLDGGVVEERVGAPRGRLGDVAVEILVEIGGRFQDVVVDQEVLLVDDVGLVVVAEDDDDVVFAVIDDGGGAVRLIAAGEQARIDPLSRDNADVVVVDPIVLAEHLHVDEIAVEDVHVPGQAGVEAPDRQHVEGGLPA